MIRACEIRYIAHGQQPSYCSGGFSIRMRGFAPRGVCMIFIVDCVQRQYFIQVYFGFSLIITIFTDAVYFHLSFIPGLNNGPKQRHRSNGYSHCPTRLKQKYAYNVPRRRVHVFKSLIHFGKSYHLIRWSESFCYCSQLLICYNTLLIFLESVIIYCDIYLNNILFIFLP